MSDFNYTVSKHDKKGLSEIFLKKAKAEGFDGNNIDWDAVMSVFDKIQAEEQAEGQSLFSGGTNKTSAGWKTSYVIKAGDKIRLNESQINEIYSAMGFKKEVEATDLTAKQIALPIGIAKPVAKDTAPEADNTPTHVVDVPILSKLASASVADAPAKIQIPEVKPQAADTPQKTVEATQAQVPADTAKVQTPVAETTVSAKPAVNVVADTTTTPSDTVKTQAPVVDTTKVQTPVVETKVSDVKDTTDKSEPAPKLPELPEWGSTISVDSASNQRLLTDSTKVDFKPVETMTQDTLPKKEKAATEYSNIKTDKYEGDYKISEGEGKDAYTLFSNVNVKGTPETDKFYKVTYDEKTKKYSAGDLKSTDEQTLRNMVNEESKSLSANQAIYTDLDKKQKAGTTLTDPEQAFMAAHVKNLNGMGLEINKEGQIAEVQKTVTPAKQDSLATQPAAVSTDKSEKSFWQKFKDLF